MARILVADDELVLRMLIVDSLEDLEVDIDEAQDGQEAVDLLYQNEYDLIILDYMMPRLTGIEVIDTITNMDEMAQRPHILMLTAKSQQRDQEEIIAKGADSFIAKPFSPLVLVEKVEGILSEILLK
ncbi:response regulator [Shouchella lehensis]|uniref:Response regulator n=1 Tax=Shouchella lehensis TaxID=300825 RepID=A0A4Y7WMG1_9BACI|nr:response regulator [Shouchella lehensis]MBG9783079.1 histidine kinase [Shouchella lehensis]TES49557.1 response regulator [Shouchella lehensis]